MGLNEYAPYLHSSLDSLIRAFVSAKNSYGAAPASFAHMWYEVLHAQLYRTDGDYDYRLAGSPYSARIVEDTRLTVEGMGQPLTEAFSDMHRDAGALEHADDTPPGGVSSFEARTRMLRDRLRLYAQLQLGTGEMWGKKRCSRA